MVDALVARHEQDLQAAYRFFVSPDPVDWVRNEANKALKRKYPEYRKIWDDAWEAIVAEERRKSREYEKWFHRNDKWNREEIDGKK